VSGRRRPPRAPEMDDSLRKSLSWLTAARIVVFFLILLSAILVQAGSGSEVEISHLYGLFGAALFLSLFHWTAGRFIPPRIEAYVQILGDLGLVSVLVYTTGGPSSVFTFLYLVVIGSAAFLLFRTGAVVIASVAALLHGLMMELTAYDVLPRPAMASLPRWGTERIAYNLAITVVGFYGVAFMVSYLSEKLRSARQELALRQKALSRIQTLYANVIASMSSGLVTADSRQRVTFLNQAGGEILGVVPARVTGKPLSEIGLDLPSAWEEIRHRTRGRTGYRSEIEIARGDARRVLGYSLRALKDPEGDEGALILFQDLTEVKKLERQARFNEQLAAVGELAAGIAHEIRNPLASISGSVQVLSNELSVGSAERRLMEIIVSESNRLSKILEEFLRFVRPQERRMAEFDVALAIQEVLDLFRLSDEISDAHRIEVDVRPRSSPLSGDRDQIRQIIYNVAKNAVRAMPDGGALTVVGREDGAWYSMKFCDTGRGMSEDEIARVFTPFSTAFDGGTGLGMAIVRRIVEDHGGAVDVDSKPGEGTTVTILLPRTAPARAADAPSAVASGAAS
jgi:two-component system sensor histidine kinase PilS (NtrC family)